MGNSLKCTRPFYKDGTNKILPIRYFPKQKDFISFIKSHCLFEFYSYFSENSANFVMKLALVIQIKPITRLLLTTSFIFNWHHHFKKAELSKFTIVIICNVITVLLYVIDYNYTCSSTEIFSDITVGVTSNLQCRRNLLLHARITKIIYIQLHCK